MMTGDYRGAVNLANSKFAPSQSGAHFAAVFPSPQAEPATHNAIATKEQIAAASDNDLVMDRANSSAQLAAAQDAAMRVEVENHSVRFASAVSSTTSNTRRLLGLIRESLIKHGGASDSDRQTVNDLWDELERLFEAATEAKAALPSFLEKQRDNMSLYHNSVANEAIQESQVELARQHKKVDIQHTLILGHQQAFQDYKAQTESKLKNINELEERVSRLTLDKGLMRTELEKYKQELQLATAKAADDYQPQLAELGNVKQELATENDALRKLLENLQETLKTKDDEITDHYQVEVRKLTERLGKESQKSAGLESLIKTLRGEDDMARKSSEKLNTEHKVLQEKYKAQTAAFSKAFVDINERDKRMNALRAEIDGLRKDNAILKEQLPQLKELELTNTELSRAKSEMSKQIDKLKAESDGAKTDVDECKSTITALSDKIKKIESLKRDLETDNNELLAKAKENSKIVTAFNIMKSENSTLLKTVNELQKQKTVPDDSVSKTADNKAINKENEDLKEQLRMSQKETTRAQGAAHEWSGLAKRSYNTYKGMLPLYKEAEQLREANHGMETQISDLKAQLLTASTSGKANGAGMGDEAIYWKTKYETLLDTTTQ